MTLSCATLTDYTLDHCLVIGNIRLAGGSNHTGRAEVYYNGSWGTFCSRFFGERDRNVLCRELGFGLSYEIIYMFPGTAKIRLEYPHCHGTEEFLRNCRFSSWEKYNCQHYHDVAVSCGE